MKPLPLEREKLVQELVKARLSKRLSRRDIARAAGVSHTLINSIESTQNCASPHILTIYATLCDLELDALLLSWNYTPEDVLIRMKRKPDLCALVRAA